MAIVLTVEPGTPTVGLWCPNCNLPSGYAIPLKSLSASGVGDFGEIRRCRDCGMQQCR